MATDAASAAANPSDSISSGLLDVLQLPGTLPFNQGEIGFT